MSSPLKSTPFDDYLDRLTGQLRFAPRDLQAEYRDEVRQHLESIAADLIAASSDGTQMTPEQAAAQAMSVFGDPKTVGRGIASEIGWGTGVMPGSLGMAVLSGIIWLTLLKIVFGFLSNLLTAPLINTLQITQDQQTKYIILLQLFLCSLLTLILVPWLAGRLTGLLAPKSAAKGMLIAFAATYALRLYESMGVHPNIDYIYVQIAFRELIYVAVGYFSALSTSMRLRGLKVTMPALLGVGGMKGRVK